MRGVCCLPLLLLLMFTLAATLLITLIDAAMLITFSHAIYAARHYAAMLMPLRLP